MQPPLQIEELVAAVACVGARVSGLLVFTPFLGSSAIAPRIKVGLAVLLTGLLYPISGPHQLSPGAAAAIRMMLGEALAGLVMGLTVQFIFEAAQFAGQAMGTQVGYGLVNIIDPGTQVDTPVLSVFTQTITMLIFLQLGVHRWLIRALASSFTYLPAGSAIAGGEMMRQLLRAAGGMWLAGVQIAAPALIATLLADFVLGFLGKASPQLPVLFLGLSVKSMLGLGVLALSLKYWPTIFDRYFTAAVHCGERLLHLAG
ncbi:MAG TPA: flagellar biosynthetic protein FliR [Candidatus Binatia bacterium]|nr:flagellar biosynthetic protein FliR [Candidatus Binatia bacterium]